MNIIRFCRNPYARLAVNIAYAVGNCVIGFISHSWWFLTVGAYYAVLSTTRFSVLQMRRNSKKNPGSGLFVKKTTGILLLFLSLCLAGINFLSITEARGTVFHEIIMITIATYTFTKITIAILGLMKAKHNPSPFVKTLRNISLADAFVSVYSLQRSMLVSFPGMTPAQIRLFNILTGTGVWLIVLFLGINLINGRCATVAKSKLVKANQKIAEAVTAGYKAVEKGVVGAYTKIEDKFVDAYLTKEGETVEQAKARLKTEQKQK